MSATITVDVGLAHASLPHDHGLRSLIAARFGVPSSRVARAPWGAEDYGLDATSVFARAPLDRRATILERLAAGVLGEAYFIERTGLAYSAKRMLAADSPEERALHATFAADEARHMHVVASLLASPEPPAPTAFHHWLTSAVEEGEGAALVFLIQVVLEGWGLAHYRRLAASSRDPRVTASLGAIVRDEAAHHGAGVTVCRNAVIGREGLDWLHQRLSAMLDLVRAGPVATLDAIEAVQGPLDRRSRARTLIEMGAERRTAVTLAEISRLVQSQGRNHELLERLERAGKLRPATVEEMS